MPPRRGIAPGRARLPRSRRLRAAASLRNQRGRLAIGYGRQIDRVFGLQSDAIVRAFLAQTPPEAFVEILNARSLQALTLRFTATAAVELSQVPAQLVGVTPYRLGDAQVFRLIAQAGTRMKGVERGTLTAIRNVIANGNALGLSDFQIAEGVTNLNYRGLASVVKETYKGRAMTIARTEMGYVNQHAAHERYAAGGLTMVEISDGADCGWTSHNDPDLADGSIRTIQEADGWALATRIAGA